MTAENASLPLLDLKAAEATGVALTPGQLAWRRFRKHRMAVIGAVGISLLLLFIIIGSVVVPETGANNIDLYNRLVGPTAIHWFGTDSTGRDVFNRIIYGGRSRKRRRCGMFYVNQRWLGGLLTNWVTVQKSVKRLKELDEMATDGRYELLPKKEVVKLERERKHLQANLAGIKNMTGCRMCCS